MKLSEHLKSIGGMMLPPFIQRRIMNSTTKKNYYTNNYNVKYKRTLYDDRCVTTNERIIIDKWYNCIINKMYRKRPKVLDVGCGNGIPYTKYLADNMNCDVVALDISKQQLARAEANIGTLKVLLQQSDILSYKTRVQFDGITLIYSSFNIPRRYHKRLLKKLYGMLRVGGAVLINVREQEVGSFQYNNDWCGKPMIFSYYSAEKFIRLASEVGFMVYEFGITSNPEYRWLMLAKVSTISDIANYLRILDKMDNKQ